MEHIQKKNGPYSTTSEDKLEKKTIYEPEIEYMNLSSKSDDGGSDSDFEIFEKPK